AGDDRVHLGVLLGGGGVDRDDAGVRVGAAKNGAVEHPGQLHVVDVVALAADEPRVLLAAHAAVADGLLGGGFLGGGHLPLPYALAGADSCSAAQRIALTMLT